MSNQFGATHRQLIKDTNAGRIEPKDVAHVSTSAAVTGATITRASDETRGTQKAFGKLLGDLAGRIGAQHQKKEFSKGYAEGTFEGYQNLKESESAIGQMLFGKSSRLRGAQQRMLHDTTENHYINNFKDLDSDSKVMSTEAYHGKLHEQLSETLSKYEGDAEIQEQLTQSFAANAKQLSRNHVQRRQIWIDAENKRAVTDNIVTATSVLTELRQNGGDEQALADAEQRLLKTFKRPSGMHPVPYSAAMASAIVTQLQRGDDTVLGLAEREGILDNLRPEDTARVVDAAKVWTVDNDKRFFEDTNALEQMSVNGVDGREQKARLMAQKYPGMFNLNDWRENDRTLELERLEEARLKQQRQMWLMTNDSRAQELTLQEKHDAFGGAIMDMSQAGVQSARMEANRMAQLTGEELAFDPDEPASPEELQEWQLDNPETLTPLWQASQQTLPQLEQSLSNINMLISSPELTQENLEVLAKHQDFADVFKGTDEALFNKHFKSDSELQRYAAYDFLINKAGVPPRNAIETLRAIAKLPEVTDVPPEMIEDGVDDALDTFEDQKGEKWLWFFNKTMDNEHEFEALASDYYEQAYRTYKGNHEMASHAVRARMLRNGTTVGNKFVPGGAVLDRNSYGGSAAEYLEAWDDDPRFKEGRWVEAGFPEDGSIYDDGVTIMPSPNGNEVIITGTSAVNGMPIFLPVPLPSRPEDFPAYDPRTFDERRDEFTQSFMRKSGISAAGRLIEKHVVEPLTEE